MAKRVRIFPEHGYSYMATYQEYIRSKDWQVKADRFKTDANYTCERCKRYCNIIGGSQLHIHHKHYNTLGRERREDVSVLCEWCHKLQHPNWR